MDIKSLNCIIIHGCPSNVEKAMDLKTRTYDKHWIPWVKAELTGRGVKTETPLMPTPWQPDYQKFKSEFEKYHIDENTVLVGHSCGCAFLVRWLGESKRIIFKLVLVAPWKIPDKDDELRKAFYNYPIDQTIKDRVKKIVMFTSDDEETDGKISLKIFHDTLGGEIIELKGHGHYTFNDMKTEEFPELLNQILKQFVKNNFWQKLPKPILALAPMAGISDSAFRQLCKSFGADVLYTEMISADALFYDSKKTIELLKFVKAEKPIVCQLFGKRPEVFPKAVKMIEKLGFDGIDINFGCPAKKVVAHGGGVTLMRDLNKCREIIQVVIKSTALPVSAKIRAGIDNVTAIDFIKAVSDLPLAALMVHGRTFKNLFAGPIDFAMIKKAKETFNGVVIGNGGINTPEDAKAMLVKTGVDGIGLARGLYGKPYLFKQIKDDLRAKKYKEYNISEIKKIALDHAKLAYKAKCEWGIIELRKHLCWYFRDFPGAAALRQDLVQVTSVAQIAKILKNI